MAETIKLDAHGELIRKVHNEYDEGLNYVNQRRQEFRDRLAMYNNQKKNKDLVGITTMYTLIRTLLGVFYSDEVTVQFKSRRFEDSEHVENLNALAAFDFDEMNLGVKNYFNQWDRLFYGVGIRIFEDFNMTTLTPSVRTISPLNWHPDPLGSPESGFRYHGFEFVVNKNELKEDAGYDMKKVSKLETTHAADEPMQNLRAEKDAQGLASGALDLLTGKDTITVYHHFTEYKGERYLITTDASKTLVLRAIKLPVYTEEERKDPLLVPYPVILNHYSPQRSVPFGTNVPDLVEDKQRMISVVVNLMLKEAKGHLYPMGIYDARKIKNKRDLDFGFNKNIPVRLNQGESLENVYKPLVRDTVDNTAWNVKSLLEQESRIATNADQLQSGVLGDKQRTLGEVQQVQANANVGYLLQSKVNAWGERDFHKYWYREYRGNFPKAGKKFIRLSRPDGSEYMELGYKDFITVEDPDVDIISKLEDEKRRERESLEFLQSLPLVLQDPTMSQAARLQAKRLYYMKKGYKKSEIDMIIPQNADEYDAHNENKLLDMNTPVNIDANDDHQSHITIHMRAQNTQAARLHIQSHQLALIRTGEMQKLRQMSAQGQAGGQDENLANMAQSQIGNRLTQMGKSETNNLV